jgi:ABC-type transport system involved in cytochrome bd biosynthesis fused ATPase/permease subunit
VQVRTDEKIQEMIRDVFQHCTVFAIAHRLATIIDYDKVVVLEKGELKQFGTPLDLLDDKDGIFARLVEENGTAVSAHLHAIARGEGRSPKAGALGDKDTQDRN